MIVIVFAAVQEGIQLNGFPVVQAWEKTATNSLIFTTDPSTSISLI